VSALVFDCDGVLADTERDGHRPAFNRTFREFGLPVEWDVEEYGRRLKIGGGKERMASLLTPEFVAANGLPADPDGQAALLATWHKRKTAIYTEMVVEGKLPPRPGIRRIIGAAQDAGRLTRFAEAAAKLGSDRWMPFVAADRPGSSATTYASATPSSPARHQPRDSPNTASTDEAPNPCQIPLEEPKAPPPSVIRSRWRQMAMNAPACRTL